MEIQFARVALIVHAWTTKCNKHPVFDRLTQRQTQSREKRKRWESRKLSNHRNFRGNPRETYVFKGLGHRFIRITLSVLNNIFLPSDPLCGKADQNEKKYFHFQSEIQRQSGGALEKRNNSKKSERTTTKKTQKNIVKSITWRTRTLQIKTTVPFATPSRYVYQSTFPCGTKWRLEPIFYLVVETLV